MTLAHVPFHIEDGAEMAYPAPPPAPVSEDAYYRWSESHGYVRAEWINGEISFMPPVGPIHANHTWWIGTLLKLFANRRKLGDVALDTWTKFDLPEPQVRGPDILFMRAGREHLITDRNVSEPPDLAIEVVSRGDESRDYRDKYHVYEASGVREYWIVDPASESIEAYRLDPRGKYVRFYETAGKLVAEVVPGWYLRMDWLWTEPRKDVLEALSELEAQPT